MDAKELHDYTPAFKYFLFILLSLSACVSLLYTCKHTLLPFLLTSHCAVHSLPLTLDNDVFKVYAEKELTPTVNNCKNNLTCNGFHL